MHECSIWIINQWVNNYKFTYCNYKKINNDKEIPVFSKKKKVSFNDLLTDCNIGLSTVLLDKTIINVEAANEVLIESLKEHEVINQKREKK